MFAHDARMTTKRNGTDAAVIVPYAVFLIVSLAVYSTLSAGFSSALTFSAKLQCLGFVLLVVKVHQSRTVCGLSAQTLAMYAVTLVFRLTSTLVKNGYLPVDRTGDGAYQATEICSLGMVLYLLFCSIWSHRHSYQAEMDTMPGAKYIAASCLLLAMLVHPHLNRSAFFDVAWTTACYLETVSLLPQLWMLSKKGGEVDGMTSHFVVLTTLSRVLSLVFWYHAHGELRPKNGGPNLAGFGIISAHVLQLLLACDFVLVYVKGLIARSRLLLPGNLN
jgi:hypothetical protein